MKNLRKTSTHCPPPRNQEIHPKNCLGAVSLREVMLSQFSKASTGQAHS